MSRHRTDCETHGTAWYETKCFVCDVEAQNAELTALRERVAQLETRLAASEAMLKRVIAEEEPCRSCSGIPVEAREYFSNESSQAW